MLPNFPKLDQVASKDKLRTNMQDIYIDYDNRYFVATSGHTLAAVPFDFFDNLPFDFSQSTAVKIPAAAWKELSKPTTIKAELVGNGLTIFDKSGSVKTISCVVSDNAFVGWKRIIPETKYVNLEDSAHSNITHINPQYLLDLSAAMGIDKKYPRIAMYSLGKERAFVAATDTCIIGLIMPLYVTEAQNGIVSIMQKALDKLHNTKQNEVVA
jgi:hypothetical protein